MKVPLFILNHDRAAPLRKLLTWCAGLTGRGPVRVLDGESSYEATHDLYRDVARGRLGPDMEVVHLGSNGGYAAAEAVMRELCAEGPVVFSDPDLEPYPETPSDAIERMASMMATYRWVVKVGMGLEILDIPACYFNGTWIKGWEARFWDDTRRTPCHLGFRAPIGQTFCLLRRPSDLMEMEDGTGIRLDHPYTLKHSDWYEDPKNPSPEFARYAASGGKISSIAVLYRAWQRDPEGFDAAIEEALRQPQPTRYLWQRFF